MTPVFVRLELPLKLANRERLNFIGLPWQLKLPRRESLVFVRLELLNSSVRLPRREARRQRDSDNHVQPSAS